jgi:hypothetical protein
MKTHRLLIVPLSIFSSTSFINAYPNQINLENNTGYKISFVADFPRLTPKTTAEYWGSVGDRVETVLPYKIAQIQETDKNKMYAIIKASPVDWEFHPGVTGQRRPVWHTFTFDEKHTGPIYLIYSDEGFSEMTQQQWQKRQSRQVSHWNER